MGRFLAIRLASFVPTLIGVSIVVFLMIRLIPGSIVNQIIGIEGSRSPETIEALRAYFGLNDPIVVQYARWMSRVLVGDLGDSWRSGVPVGELILSRLAVTLQLTLGAILIALLIGIPLGIGSALRENTRVDHVMRVVGLLGLSVPIFWQAAMLLLVLSRGFSWAPPVGFVSFFDDPRRNLETMLLPCLVLGTATAAMIMRMTRASVLEVMRQDYVRTARAKGLVERRIVAVHIMKNALIPVVTVTGAQIGYLLGGSLVTEQVFALSGIGRLVLDAVYQRDYPVVQGVVLFIAVMFMAVNLLVDGVYALLDPRIRLGRS